VWRSVLSFASTLRIVPSIAAEPIIADNDPSQMVWIGRVRRKGSVKATWHKLQQTKNYILSIVGALSFRAAPSIAFVFLGATASTAQTDPVDWVNLFIGTGSGPIGYGGTMPFVTPPFGMTDWTPQTRQNKLSVVSYKYEDTDISGFIGTHQPAIWMGDYGY
jgi:hypothetical protein